VRMYPGRDSNPHAIKAVALKATVSDQFHHPGRVSDGIDSRTHRQAFRGSRARRLPIDRRIERLLGSNFGVLRQESGPAAREEIG
jgi:hypothetical protein